MKEGYGNVGAEIINILRAEVKVTCSDPQRSSCQYSPKHPIIGIEGWFLGPRRLPLSIIRRKLAGHLVSERNGMRRGEAPVHSAPGQRT